MNLEEMERVMNELQTDKIKRDAVADFKKDCFTRFKDIILAGCALIGGILGLIGFIRTL